MAQFVPNTDLSASVLRVLGPLKLNWVALADDQGDQGPAFGRKRDV